MRDINLIPKEYLKEKTRPSIIAASTIFAALMIALSAYLYIIPLNNIKALEKEISKYDEVVLDYNVLKSKMEKMQENEAVIRQKLEVLDKISADEVKPTSVFELVYSSMPKDLWLTNMNYTFTDVSLTAVAASAAGATEFYTEISKKDGFRDVTLSPLTIDENGYNFTIQFSLGTGSDEKNEN